MKGRPTDWVGTAEKASQLADAGWLTFSRSLLPLEYHAKRKGRQLL